MHPFTQERLDQEREYADALRKDQEMEEKIALEQAITASLADTVVDVIEESTHQEEQAPLTLEQLRRARLAYYQPSMQCEAITVAGVRCKRNKSNQFNKYCTIHIKKRIVI